MTLFSNASLEYWRSSKNWRYWQLLELLFLTWTQTIQNEFSRREETTDGLDEELVVTTLNSNRSYKSQVKERRVHWSGLRERGAGITDQPSAAVSSNWLTVYAQHQSNITSSAAHCQRAQLKMILGDQPTSEWLRMGTLRWPPFFSHGVGRESRLRSRK